MHKDSVFCLRLGDVASIGFSYWCDHVRPTRLLCPSAIDATSHLFALSVQLRNKTFDGRDRYSFGFARAEILGEPTHTPISKVHPVSELVCLFGQVGQRTAWLCSLLPSSSRLKPSPAFSSQPPVSIDSPLVDLNVAQAAPALRRSSSWSLLHITSRPVLSCRHHHCCVARYCHQPPGSAGVLQQSRVSPSHASPPRAPLTGQSAACRADQRRLHQSIRGQHMCLRFALMRLLSTSLTHCLPF